MARGAAAGAFAAMVPAFGLHLALALGTALLARGSLAAAAATCLLFGNPLVHAVELPLAYELGRWLIPAGYPGPACAVVTSARLRHRTAAERFRNCAAGTGWRET